MKFEINGFDYEILRVDKNDDNLVVGDSKKIGCIHFDTCKIYISNNLSRQMEKSTVIHELTHAFMSAYGFLGFEQFNHECICEFISSYAEGIMKITNKYLEIN